MVDPLKIFGELVLLHDIFEGNRLLSDGVSETYEQRGFGTGRRRERPRVVQQKLKDLEPSVLVWLKARNGLGLEFLPKIAEPEVFSKRT